MAIDDFAIVAENLGVQYSLRFHRKQSVQRTLSRWLSRDRAEPFWALRDVNLRVTHGESLAVIGPNGAGKSTLLQVLAGIISPSEGRIQAAGHGSCVTASTAGWQRRHVNAVARRRVTNDPA